MVDLRTTLLWWVLTRYHVWAIGSALLAVWGYVDMWNEPDANTRFVVGCIAVGLLWIHMIIWKKAHRHRERVRGLIRARVLNAERQWGVGTPWPSVKLPIEYFGVRDDARFAALRRPDLWGKWTLNVYCGETDTHFASGCDSWPRWVWEPVKG